MAKLPIISYGHSVLRQKCSDIGPGYPELGNLIDNMWETLYASDGCGLAAPQVNHAIKLFTVDSLETYNRLEQEDRDELFEGDTGIKEVFINACITDYSDDSWLGYEGCLSLPGLSEEVDRAWSITISYVDSDFQKQTKTFHGTTARMIQHEYDHTLGKLYIDHLKPLKRRLMAGALSKISKGQVKVGYSMQFMK